MDVVSFRAQVIVSAQAGQQCWDLFFEVVRPKLRSGRAGTTNFSVQRSVRKRNSLGVVFLAGRALVKLASDFDSRNGANVVFRSSGSLLDDRDPELSNSPCPGKLYLLAPIAEVAG